MYLNGTKKVLFVVGMEQNMEDFIEKMPHINSENVLILKSYNPALLQPFGDLMRDILVAVYEENIEEIFVITTKDDQIKYGALLDKLHENKDLQGKIRTLNYLLKNCMPEFVEDGIDEWLTGSSDHFHNSVDIIRHHPLMPSDIKVQELLIENVL